jgi:ElaB/YqjD/DUF883 family membrane-anchored ribosome-binding protein
MTQQVRQNMPPPTTEVAKDQATDVGRTTADAGRHVADTATEQAGQVAQEAKRQARDLLGEARSQAREQAQTGQQKAADSIRGLAVELLLDAPPVGPAVAVLSRGAVRSELRLVERVAARKLPGVLIEDVFRVRRANPRELFDRLAACVSRAHRSVQANRFNDLIADCVHGAE